MCTHMCFHAMEHVSEVRGQPWGLASLLPPQAPVWPVAPFYTARPGPAVERKHEVFICLFQSAYSLNTMISVASTLLKTFHLNGLVLFMLCVCVVCISECGPVHARLCPCFSAYVKVRRRLCGSWFPPSTMSSVNLELKLLGL